VTWERTAIERDLEDLMMEPMEILMDWETMTEQGTDEVDLVR
jgi:hypothetical protein